MSRKLLPQEIPASQEVFPSVIDNEVDVGKFNFPDQQQPPEQIQQRQIASQEIDFPDQLSPLEGSYNAVAKQAPDQAAKIIDLANKTGHDRSFIEEHLNEVEETLKHPGSGKFSEFESKYPGASKWLIDPDNMAIAKDDLDNIGKHEELISGMKEANTFYDALRAGYQNSVTGLTIRGKMPDLALSESSSLINRLGSQAATMLGDMPAMVAGGMMGAQSALPVSAALAATGVAVPAAFMTEAAGAAAGAFALPAAMRQVLLDKYNEGDIKGFENFLSRVSKVMTEAGKGYATGLATSGSASVTKELVGGTIAPLAAEIVAMTSVGKGLEGEVAKPMDYLEGAILVGGLHMATSMGGKVANLYVEGKRTQKTKEFFTALGDTVEASKARERLAPSHQALVNNLTKDGNIKDVLIPIERFDEYFQTKGIDPEKAASDLGVSKEHTTARETGNELSVPLSTFVDKFVGSEHYQGLSDDVKFNRDGFTVNEYNQLKTEVEQEIQAQQAQAEQIRKDGQVKATSESVANKIADAMRMAGVPESRIKPNAAVWEAFFKTMAERTGQDPIELFNKYNIKVEEGQTPKEQPPIKFDLMLGEEALAKHLATKERAEQYEEQMIDQHMSAMKQIQEEGRDNVPLSVILAARDAESALAMTAKVKDRLPSVGQEFWQSEPPKTQEPGTEKITFSGVLKAVHGSPVKLDRFRKVNQVDPKNRYGAGDGLFGSYTYFDETGSWVSSDSPMQTVGRGIIATHVYGVELKLEKALVISPENISEVKEALSGFKSKDRFGKDDLTKLPEYLKEKGYDGIVIRGMDKLTQYHEETISREFTNQILKIWEKVREKEDSLKKDAVTWGEVDKIENSEEYKSLYNEGKKRVDVLLEQQKSAQKEYIGGLPGDIYDWQDQIISFNPEQNAKIIKAFNDNKTQDAVTKFLSGELYQNDGVNRGKISFGKNSIDITLFKDADFSTFLHESGHFFLKSMGDLASMPEAPEQIKKDFAEILKYIGAESVDKIETVHHEKFASAIETYFKEGKAPSKGLRKVFDRFKKWLTSVYKDAKINGIELSDDIRSVMDRMFATDEEIKAAQSDIGYKDQVSVLAPEQAKAIKSLQEQARMMAEEQLLKEQIPETKKEHKDFIESERKRITSEAEKEVSEMPVFAAGESIHNGIGTKKPIDELANKFLDEKLPDNSMKVFEMAAIHHGFENGTELARAIIEADRLKLREASVSSLVESRMKEHASLMDTEMIRESALNAIHNDRSVELLALEKEIIKNLQSKDPAIQKEVSRRNREAARIQAVIAKEKAKDILGVLPFKEASSFRTYITAERRAAERVSAALARKDYKTAAKYKAEQMLNHALAAEAMRNRQKSNKAVDYLTDVGKRGQDLLKAPYGFVRIADSLLTMVGLKDAKPEDSAAFLKIAQDMELKGDSAEAIASATGFFKDESGNWRQETLSDFVARINNEYRDWIPPSSIFDLKQKEYKALSMNELLDLKDAIKEIIGIGKKYNGFLTNLDKLDMSLEQKRTAESIIKNVGTKYADKMLHGSKFSNKTDKIIHDILNFSMADASIPILVHLEALCNVLDKGDVNGPMHENLYRVLKSGSDKKLVLQERIMKGMNEVLDQYMPSKEFEKEMKKIIFVPETGKYHTKEEILLIAMNMGNEGNRSRLRNGGLATGVELTDEKLISIINLLDKRDLDHVQRVWDFIHTLWPDIVELETRVRGSEPKMVERTPIETRHGSYAGGYFPIAYDFEKSIEAHLNAKERNALFKQGGYASATTDRGHAKARTAYVNRPLRLKTDVIYSHLENVAHDLAYREAVIDANRFMRGRDVRSAIQKAVDIGGLKLIDGVIKDTASVQPRGYDLSDKIIGKLRSKTSGAALMLRIANFFTDTTGNALLAGSEGGYVEMTKHISDYVRDKDGVDAFIDSKSPRMHNRGKIKEKDILSYGKEKNGQESAMRAYGFYLYMAADENLSRPLWMLTYKENLSKYGERKAIDIADEAVLRTFGSSDVIDRVGIQRKGGLWDATTMFMSWSSMMFNRLWKDGKIAGLEYKDGNKLTAIKIAATTLATTWLVPAVNEIIWKEALRNSPPGSQDDEGKEKRVVRGLVKQGARYVWGFRDVVGAAVDLYDSKQNAHYSLSPIEDSALTIMKPYMKLLERFYNGGKEWTEKDVEEWFKSLSRTTGYPQQLNDMAFNFYDAINSENSLTWKDFMNRRTKK